MSIFDYFKGEEQVPEEPADRASSLRETLAVFSGNVEEDKRRYPEDSADIGSIFDRQKVRFKQWRAAGNTNQNAKAFFFLSEDKMRAFACIFPPTGDGADVNVDGFFSNLQFEGITHGILQEEIRRHIEGKDYLHIFPVAAGTPPVDGTDGEVTDFFPRMDAPRLEAGSRELLDFSAPDFVFTHAGDEICRIRLPEPGKAGANVTGEILPCLEGAQVWIPMGNHTRLSPDGLSLVAAKSGLLYIKENMFCVRPCQVVDGDVTGPERVLQVTGGVYISGSVSGGARVEASGSVVIGGQVQDAVIASGGTIRVQGGVLGVADQTILKADKQVQAPFLERAYVDASGSVFAQRILDSSVITNDTLNVLTGEGSIVGGYIQALHRVLCLRIGSPDGGRCSMIVGCDPQVVAEWEQNRKAMAANRQVMDKLWSNIAALRRGEAWMNDDQKEVLQTLLEQRALYEEQRSNLKQERETLRAQLRVANTGHIRCRELYPVLEVMMGERSGEVKTRENECDIHLRDQDIRLR